MIHGLSPDALSLQEIGDPAALTDVVGLLDGSLHRRVSKHPNQRHIRVAGLTQPAISDPVEIFQFPEHLQPAQVDDDGNRQALESRDRRITAAFSASRRVFERVRGLVPRVSEGVCLAQAAGSREASE
jgi:hypothetical protein